MLSKWRSDFPLLKKTIGGLPLIYLDTAATAYKPQVVIDALSSFYTEHYGTVHRGVYTTTREATLLYEEARRCVQHFLHAAHFEEIIFTRGTTASLNLVARSFGRAYMQKGDVVLISEVEHHSNIVPWQMLREEIGIELRIIPVDERGELCFERFLELLDEKVKLVSIAHVSNVVGTIFPIREIVEAAHRVGAKVCVDGAQAAAHMPVDVQELDVDFYAFSGHKAYGPTGIGVLYGKRELLEKMPPLEGGGDMIETVTFEKTLYNQLPLKFEAGTPPFAQAIGLKVALEYVTAIGLSQIHAHDKELLRYAMAKFQEIPAARIIGDSLSKSGLISFLIDGIHPLDLATFLDCRGIALRSGHLCAQPALKRFGVTSLARISFGLYTTPHDLDIFFLALQESISIFR